MANILEIHDLHVDVRGEPILHGVDLAIPEGEVHALLGPNGSGKTSLMMTIMGFSGYKVTRGKILFDGKDITQASLTERARMGIAVAQQRPPTIPGVRLRQVVEYISGKDEGHRAEVAALVEAVRVRQFMDREINAGLSGGEIRRSEMLQLLAMRPRFAMLDEIDSGVDIEALELIGGMANQLFSVEHGHPVRRRSGLIITHTGQVMEHVHADRAHIIMRGKISCTGNPGIIFDMVCESGYEKCVECVNHLPEVHL